MAKKAAGKPAAFFVINGSQGKKKNNVLNQFFHSIKENRFFY